jgi:alkylation response protein AidB-like acyl-CoA dehydrogenase
MQLGYEEQHQMLADTLARFVAKEYPFETRDKIANSSSGYSAEIWQQLAEIGIIGALFDEDAGGFGGTGVDIALIFEGLGRGIVAEPFLATLLGGTCLEGGSDAHRSVLEEAIAGTRLVTLAHSDPEAGYETEYVTATARRDGDDWVVDGRKIAVPFGGVADDLVVAARTAGDATDTDGISLFLVAGTANGVSRSSYLNVDGGTSADIELASVRVGEDALIGEEGRGLELLRRAIGRGVLALSAEALGAMSVTSDMTLQYLRDRRQFGVPIGSFQALQHRMADVVIGIEQARSAVVNAASELDEDETSAGRSLAAAKYTTGRTGRLVAEEAIQMHGGNGMIWEVAVAHFAKRLVMIDHQLGDEDFHLQRFIALGADVDPARASNGQ